MRDNAPDVRVDDLKQVMKRFIDGLCRVLTARQVNQKRDGETKELKASGPALLLHVTFEHLPSDNSAVDVSLCIHAHAFGA